MMQHLAVFAALVGTASAQVFCEGVHNDETRTDECSALSVVRPMLEPNHCPEVSPLEVGPLVGPGMGQVVACHNDMTDGSCNVVVQRSDGTQLEDGGTYAPGETLTFAIISACQLSADNACGDGREVLMEVEGTTFAGGEGTKGCDDRRMINPFRPPTVIAPTDGPLVFRGATAYCRGTANDSGDNAVTSRCYDQFHLADSVTLMPGGSGPSTCTVCKGDLDGVSFPGDGIQYPNDRNFFKVTVDDLLILLANFGQTCEDPSSVPDSVDSGGPSIVPIATGPTGPIERVVNGDLNGPVVDNTIAG